MDISLPSLAELNELSQNLDLSENAQAPPVVVVLSSDDEEFPEEADEPINVPEQPVKFQLPESLRGRFSDDELDHVRHVNPTSYKVEEVDEESTMFTTAVEVLTDPNAIEQEEEKVPEPDQSIKLDNDGPERKINLPALGSLMLVRKGEEVKLKKESGKKLSEEEEMEEAFEAFMLAKQKIDENRKQLAESYELECIDLDETATKQEPEFKPKQMNNFF